MFASPVTENEVESVINSLKGNSSAGFDEVPEFLVKRSLHYIKKPLAHVCNISVKSGIFPNMIKVAKIRPLI
jgi:hypothetical protein